MSKVPNVVAELLRRGWTDEEVKAALGNNLLRVLRDAEEVRNRHTHTHTTSRPVCVFDITSSITQITSDCCVLLYNTELQTGGVECERPAQGGFNALTVCHMGWIVEDGKIPIIGKLKAVV